LSTVEYPLRERRKRRTRAALIEAGQALFGAQGFECTTLEQIADRAGVHVQTLYRHFPNKEALALAPEQARFDGFRAQVADPGRERSALALWREWVAAWARDVTGERREGFLARARNRDSAPALAVAHLRLWHDYEDLLTAEIARDLGCDAGRSRLPRLIACMLWGGNHAALRRWVADDGRSDLVGEVLGVIDEVAGMFDQANGKRATAPGGRDTAASC
jgi:AcrR family transcriptional regulator